MSIKTTIVLPEETAQRLIKLAGSSRKQGEFLTTLIDAAWANQVKSDSITLESLRLQQIGLSAENKMFDARLLQVERQLAALIAESMKQ